MLTYIDKLVRVHDSGVTETKSCLPNTRTKTLDELANWLNNPDGARSLFVLGGAGVGKSSVAHSIALRFKKLGRLAAFFRFDLNFQKDRHPGSVLPTVARSLADWSSEYKQALVDVLRKDSQLANITDVKEQWSQLIVLPTRQMKLFGPSLIVINAFDECTGGAPGYGVSGLSQSRRALLQCLTEGVLDLPANMRVLVTSRWETDVSIALRNTSLFKPFRLDEMKDEAKNDIKAYIRYRFDKLEEEELEYLDHPEHLNDSALVGLVNRSEGLFQWAFTACELMLSGMNTVGMSLDERLLQIGYVNENQRNNALDDLYTKVLLRAFGSAGEAAIEDIRSILGQIITAQQPLSINEHKQLRRSSENTSNKIQRILRELGAVLDGTMNTTSLVRPFHTSFQDFLISRDRSHDWYVDVQKEHMEMAKRCLIIMNEKLHFNMCKLKTSYLKNKDIPELLIWIDEHITADIKYAVKFWTSHLDQAIFKDDLYDMLGEFVRSKLLFWLEVMSLLQAVGSLPIMISRVLQWLNVSNNT
jgi:hypothetical protein